MGFLPILQLERVMWAVKPVRFDDLLQSQICCSVCVIPGTSVCGRWQVDRMRPILEVALVPALLLFDLRFLMAGPLLQRNQLWDGIILGRFELQNLGRLFDG